eukprot:Phypoly_transcript_02453.p1 GENE.Phypoly_transcript_02453~~Phypoly_transcript_02453.p1  ORF type:complete len:837 (+),score=158.90 Phypoly_transcript_02453:78-2588(+)
MKKGGPSRVATATTAAPVKDENPNNIYVAVRVRPENAFEAQDKKFRPVVRVLDEHVLIFDPNNWTAPRGRGPNKFGLSNRCREQQYAFDRVVDQYATQEEIYETTTKSLIPFVTNGFNATVFAYGATGAGKTHTMIGNEVAGPGVMVLTMRDLFLEVEGNKADKNYKISMQYLEVYNETIRDLLVENSRALDLREDPEVGVFVAGLCERYPKTADEVFQLLEYGNANRRQSPTEANATSSRSHAVLQIIIRSKDRTADVRSSVRTGKLSLIDLAGSERAAVTKNRGERLVEGANINKSLLALGNCINALGEGYKKGNHVPYRNSKLTRLLKDSLGGNCRTVMIANVSPSSACYEDTHNTLKYANRAKNIQTKVSRNVMDVNVHISQYPQLIKELRNEIAELKLKLQMQNKAPGVPALLPSRTAPAQAAMNEQERKEMQGSMDLIHQNMQDTLVQKKKLSSLDDRAREAKREMKKKNRQVRRMEEALKQKGQDFEPGPPELQALRNQAAFYHHSWKECQANAHAVIKKLEKNDEFRRKLATEVPNKFKSPRTQKTIIAHARACALELDKYDLGENVMKERTQLTHEVDENEQLRGVVASLGEIAKAQFQILKEHGLISTQLQQDYSKATWQADQLSDTIADSPYSSPATTHRSFSGSLPGSPRNTTSSSTNFYPKTPDYRSALITGSPTTPPTNRSVLAPSTVKAPSRVLETPSLDLSQDLPTSVSTTTLKSILQPSRKFNENPQDLPASKPYKPLPYPTTSATRTSALSTKDSNREAPSSAQPTRILSTKPVPRPVTTATSERTDKENHLRTGASVSAHKKPTRAVTANDSKRSWR